MLMPSGGERRNRWEGEGKGREPIDLFRPGTEKRIPDRLRIEKAHLSLSLSLSLSSMPVNGVVMYEEADRGMPRVPIRAVESGSFQPVRHVASE